jgi:glutamate N-acetyltransferase/amino-acid N-acetyltransferase
MALTSLGCGVCVPAGYLAAGVAAGLKGSGDLDLALVTSERRAAVAGMFTSNRAAAPPVHISRARVRGGYARGVVINAGCANAMTGERGLRDAEQMAQEAAACVGVPGTEMLVCSTGVIGTFLPMERVRDGVAAAAAALGRDDGTAARAIMTSDSHPKHAAVRHSDGWAVGGMAKGSGMVAPRLATMLTVVTTDARATPADLRTALAGAVDQTLNTITIDGDTSTNDSVLAFANGAAEVEPARDDLTAAITAVCATLAEAIVADGEGATKLVRVGIAHAANDDQARAAARSVAESLLVKCSLNGGEPIWGLVAAAIGQAQVDADFDRLTIAMGNVVLLDRGMPVEGAALAAARGALLERELRVDVDLASGSASAEMLTTDLSQDYVRLNSQLDWLPRETPRPS